MQFRELAASIQASYRQKASSECLKDEAAGTSFKMLQSVDDEDGFNLHNSSQFTLAPHKLLTLIFVLKRRGAGWQVLLGHKARGFGQGKWNGFGGKVEKGVDASVAESAARELQEESGLIVRKVSNGTSSQYGLYHVGLLYFQYPVEGDGSSKTYQVHVFATVYDDAHMDLSAAPTPSEEMDKIEWFDVPCGGDVATVERPIPFHSMWGDDPYWLPPLLKHLVSTRPEEWSTYAVGYADFYTMGDIRGYCFMFGLDVAGHIPLIEETEGVPVLLLQ